MRDGKYKTSWKRWPCFWNMQKQPLRGGQKDTSPKYFFKFQEHLSRKVRHHLKVSWATVKTTSGESDYKICFSIITDPLNRIEYSFLKKYAHEKHLLDIKKKIRINNKVKCTVLEKTIIAKFGVIENFYSDLPRIHIESK